MEKKLFSCFLVTINLNFYPTDENLEDCVRKFYESLCNLICNNYDKSTKQVGKTWENDFVPPFLKHAEEGNIKVDDVKCIKCNISIELGKRGSLHSHLLIDITHTSKIHIDKDFIRTNFCNYLRSNGFLKLDGDLSELEHYKVYCNVKHIRGCSENMNELERVQRYITKEDSNLNIIQNIF